MDRNARTHASRCDEALSGLRRAVRLLEEPILHALAGGGHGDIQVEAPARLWSGLVQALHQAEPWPLELLGPVGRMVTRPPTPERPTYLQETVPVLFTRGHHEHLAFAMYARSAARAAGLPRPMVTEQALNEVMVWAWWKQDGERWVPAVAGDPDQVPVTVWFVPAWEGGIAPPTPE